MNSAAVDLIYLDPPFNSNRSYEAPIGSEAAGAAFKDSWTLSDVDLAWHGEVAERGPALYSIIAAAGLAHGKPMQAYLIMMAVRLLEMRRLLKPSGSIYLHCDPTASHYLKMTMDCIFGRAAFAAEITWKRTSAHNDKLFGSVTDSILYYGGGVQRPDDVLVPLDPDYLAKHYRHEDARGQHSRGDLTGPGVSSGESGLPWRGFDPGSVGRCWSVPKQGKYAKYLDQVLLPGYLKIEGVLARLDALAAAGMIHFPRTPNGQPRLKRYLMPDAKQRPANLWTDIPPVSSRSKQSTKYPTQKPLALLERIIRASSNPGDMVLDPFCGCATACVAAEQLGRRWTGIDISPKAAELVRLRLHKELGLFYRGVHRTDIPQRTDLGALPRYNAGDNKQRLFGRQEGRCNGCLTMFPYRNFTTDHVVPRSRGGSDHLDNLQLLCAACNSAKGVGSQEQLVARLLREGVRTA